MRLNGQLGGPDNTEGSCLVYLEPAGNTGRVTRKESLGEAAGWWFVSP